MQVANFNAIGHHTVTLPFTHRSVIGQNSKNTTLAMLNLTVLTHMLLQAQQLGLHKCHLSLVQHTRATFSCNLSQSHTTNIRPTRHWGWCITQQINTCSRDTNDNTHTLQPATNHAYHIETKAQKIAQERTQKWWLFAIVDSLETWFLTSTERPT